MNPVDSLKAVLCGQDGKCCIAGSEADRKVVDEALAALDAAQPKPVLRWCDKCGEGTVQGLCRGKMDDCKFKQAQQPTNLELSASDFSPAPHASKWGAGMMVADVVLDKDETLTVFAHKDALHLLQSATLRQEVEAMRHRLSLSFQIRRAIKAEDALNVAQNLLNALLNYANCESDSSFRPHFDRIVKEARAAASQPKETATYTPPKINDPDAPHPCFN